MIIADTKKPPRRPNQDKTYHGSSGNDWYDAGDGNDVMFGGKGNDTLSGGNGSDTIFGEQGNDVLYGNAGIDYIEGGEGNDLIHGGSKNDVLNGGAGNDSIYGDGGDDILFDASGKNFLWGGAGSDGFVLTGGQNIAAGDIGNDFFSIGGTQNSTLAGGEGRDVYFFGQIIDGNGFGSALPTGTITILEDFSKKNWGVIDLTSLNVELVGTTPDTRKNDLYIKRLGGSIVIDVFYNNRERLSIVLQGATSLNPKDFLLY